MVPIAPRDGCPAFADSGWRRRPPSRKLRSCDDPASSYRGRDTEHPERGVNANVPVSIAGGNIPAPVRVRPTRRRPSRAPMPTSSEQRPTPIRTRTTARTSAAPAVTPVSGVRADSRPGSRVPTPSSWQSGSPRATRTQSMPTSRFPDRGRQRQLRPELRDAERDPTANADVKNTSKTDRDQTCPARTSAAAIPARPAVAVAWADSQAGIQDAQTQQPAVGIARERPERSERERARVDRGRQRQLHRLSELTTQNATSTANADVKNTSKTDQDQTLTQNIGGSGLLRRSAAVPAVSAAAC